MRRFFFLLTMLSLFVLVMPSVWTRAQQEQQPATLAAIDALLALPDTQRETIVKEDNPSDRVNVALRLAVKRLDLAKQEAASQPTQSVAEIENYQNLIDYVNLFISSVRENPREQKQLYKVFEIALREYLDSLSDCERMLDEPHSSAIGRVVLHTRQCRTEALNFLFGNPILAPAK